MFTFSEEDQLLSAIIPEGNIANLQFKLTPAYLTYMAARFAFNAIHVGNRAINLTLLCNKMAARIYRLIKVKGHIASLALGTCLY